MAPQSFFTQRLTFDEDKFRLEVPQHSDPVLPRQGYVSWKSREEGRGHERMYHGPLPESGKQGLLCHCPTAITFMEMKG